MGFDGGREDRRDDIFLDQDTPLVVGNSSVTQPRKLRLFTPLFPPVLTKTEKTIIISWNDHQSIPTQANQLRAFQATVKLDRLTPSLPLIH